MEGLGFVFIIVIFILSSITKSGKQKKEGQPPAKGAASPAAKTGARAAAPAQARTTPVKPAQKTRRPAAVSRPVAAPAAAATPAPSAPAPAATAQISMEGTGLFDDEGCIGGSMAHNHAEGESHAEHSRHITAMRDREREEAAIAAPKGVAALDPRDLRRAVVISEILGKPKALQRRAG